MVALRRKIRQVIIEEAVPKPTNLSFLKTEWMVRSLAKSESSKQLPMAMPLQGFSRWALNTSGVAERNVADLLDYLHLHGTVRSYHHRTHPESAWVFPSTGWFLEQVTTILSCSLTEAGANVPIPYRTDINKLLREKGILTERLCKYLWKEMKSDVCECIMDVMKQFGFQCPSSNRFEIPEAAGRLYHVPMCIQRHPSALERHRRDWRTGHDLLILFRGRVFPLVYFVKFGVLLLQHYWQVAKDPKIDLNQVGILNSL